MILAAGVATSCSSALRLTPDDSEVVLAGHRLDAPDPARPGPHQVRRLYYGSGTDRRRAEFRDSVALETTTVDASKFVSLSKEQAATRKKYWGFEPKAFPRNARVWYPEGEGPFPLVLIVHGNHDMKDYSDPGYGYLGELLASRGYILASVDMNFLNGSIRGENDARGWMLLKHLELWREWHGTEGNPFHGKVDLERISLIGHSRGGEAVAHAAAFNHLTRYPDDANVRFDFGFRIRSLIAISPVDGQYKPADRPTPVENVDYLVFHGSHDGDVTSFMGLRQYQRVRFTDGEPHFKSAVYVYRANHGQWNSVWGAHDNGPRSPRILDLRGLIPAADQRRFAEVYVSAFLETTLRGDQRYLPLFRDHRLAGGWLPKTMYITRFQESSFRALATFEEDVDPTTGGVPGLRLHGDSLAVWKEAALEFRSSGAQDNNAVWLGWNNNIAGDDTTRLGPPATYTITLPDTLARAWSLDHNAALSFLLAPTDAKPGPRKAPKDTTAAGDSAVAGVGTVARAARTKASSDKKDTTPIDLTIEVVDAAGAVARVPLSRYGVARRPLEVRVLRRQDREKSRFQTLHELVLQSYTIPLADLVATNPALDPARITAVRFVFDRTSAGTVVLDEIGFATPDPAFLVAQGHQRRPTRWTPPEATSATCGAPTTPITSPAEERS
jgi:dienelactone hydrolase